MVYENKVIIIAFFLFFLSFSKVNSQVYDTTVNVYTAKAGIFPVKAFITNPVSDTLQLHDVLHGCCEFYFPKNDFGVLQPNTTRWLMFTWINKSHTTPLLRINGDFDATVYYADNTGAWKSKSYSVYSSISSKEYFIQEHVFSLPYSDSLQTVYIKANGLVRTGSWVQFVSPEHLATEVIIKHVYHSVFGTLLGIMIVVSMLLFLRLKDTVYLYYSLFVLFISIFSAAKWGFLYSVFGKWHIHYHYLTIPYGLSNIFLLAYTRKFLNTKSTYPYLDAILLAAIWVRIVFLAVTTLFTDKSPVFTYDPKMDLLLVTPVVVAAVVALYRKYRPARYFTASISVIYIAFFINAFGIPVVGYIIPEEIDSLFFRSRNFIQSNMVINFSFIELFLFTFALADRFFMLKKEAAIATQKIIDTQKDLLQKAQENQKLKDELNYELELRVKERTAELSEANARLHEQAEEIKRMNEMLREDNERLVHNIELLNKARVLTKNLSYTDFQGIFHDDTVCLNFIADVKWNNGYRCRSCGYRKFYLVDDHLSRKCRSCKHKESPMAYTLLENVKFDIAKALYIVYITFNEDSPNVSQMADEISLRKATCYQFYNKAKQVKDIIPPKQRKAANWTTLITWETN